MEKLVTEILDSLNEDVDKYKDINLNALEPLSTKDKKFEERMVKFIVSTLPRELEILKIDAVKEDWIKFEDTLLHINKKLQLIGASELQNYGSTLSINYILYHNFGKLADKLISFNQRINNLLFNIKDLFYIDD